MIDIEYSTWSVNEGDKYVELPYNLAIHYLDKLKVNIKTLVFNFSFLEQSKNLYVTNLSEHCFLKNLKNLFTVVYNNGVNGYEEVSCDEISLFNEYHTVEIKYQIYPKLLCLKNLYDSIIMPYIQSCKKYAAYQNLDIENTKNIFINSLGHGYGQSIKKETILGSIGYVIKDLAANSCRFVSLYELLLITTFNIQFFKNNKLD